MKPTTLALATLAAVSSFLLGATTIHGLHNAEEEELRCVVLDDLTPKELQKAMHKLVFGSRSTVMSGVANLKIDDKTVMTGYVCGW